MTCLGILYGTVAVGMYFVMPAVRMDEFTFYGFAILQKALSAALWPVIVIYWLFHYFSSNV